MAAVWGSAQHRMAFGLSIALATGACPGSFVNPATDAGTGPTADSGSGLASVTVLADGILLANADAVFHDSDGQVRSTATTNQDGQASAEVTDSALVTIIFPPNDSGITHLATIAGVMPGDNLRIARPGTGSLSTSTTAHITIPAQPSGATQYDVTAGCVGNLFSEGYVQEQTGREVTLGIRQDCLDESGNFNIIIIALDADEEPVQFAVKTGIPQGGSTTTVDGLSFSNAWQILNMTASRAPEGTVAVHGYTQLVRSGLVFPGGAMYWQDVPIEPGSGVHFSFILPSMVSEQNLEYRLDIDYGTTSNIVSTTTWRKRVPAATLAVELDMPHDTAPRLIRAGQGMSENDRPEIGWETDYPVGGMQAGWVWLSWTKSGFDYDWRVLFPPQQRTAFELPALPEEFATIAPTAELINVSTIQFLKCDTAESYADVKAGRCPIFGFDPRKRDDYGISYVTAIAR